MSQTRMSSGAAIYLECLQDYWAGEHQAAIDRLTKALASQPDQPARFQLYRLWIETLAELNDKAALRALGSHLLQRGQSKDRLTYMGLRGIVHLELDEIQAARLLARALGDDGELDDPYGLELIQRVSERKHSGGPLALLRFRRTGVDYFHLQSLAKGLLANHDRGGLIAVLKRVSEVYPAAPLPHVFEMHRSIDIGDFDTALTEASRLCQLFPSQVDYHVAQAFVLVKKGDFALARQKLEETAKLSGEQDPDVASLLAHCYAELAKREGGMTLKKATTYLQRAVAVLKEHGLPCTAAAMQLAGLDEEEDTNVDELPSARSWLIKLSPRRYAELRHATEGRIQQLVRPMGNGPRPGELCFFAGEDEMHATQSGATRWRIAAIYAVSCEPAWHPVDRYQSVLQLVSRPNEAIAVDVQMADTNASAARSDVAPGDPYRFGVFELEGGALDIITQAIRQHRGAEESEDKTGRNDFTRLQRPS